MLRTFVLALRYGAGGNMGNPHRGVRGVDVLAALARGPVSVNAQFIGLDIDVDGIVDFGADENRGKGSVPPLRGIKG